MVVAVWVVMRTQLRQLPHYCGTGERAAGSLRFVPNVSHWSQLAEWPSVKGQTTVNTGTNCNITVCVYLCVYHQYVISNELQELLNEVVGGVFQSPLSLGPLTCNLVTYLTTE